MPRAKRDGLGRQPGAILDLFAGAGGWEVALAALGLQALGIETDPHACATAQAAGYERQQADVSDLDPCRFAPVWGLVGSPPCQAYSSAGKGLGRKDKPIVIACAHELAAGNDSRRAWREGCRDPRSLLTVEPLRYIVALRPRWVALEQVPAVLELWTLFASLLAQHGYQSAAGVLSAEKYGVPQTRKRAFLIASLDGPVHLPAPTHRSYNPRRSEIPEDELALLPWVSMADALGWPTACPGSWPQKRPAPTLVTTRRSKNGALVGRQLKPGQGCERGGWAWRNGNQPNSAVRQSGAPAPTVLFGQRANKVEWVPAWSGRRPATTLACDPRIPHPGQKRSARRPHALGRSQGAVRVTVGQAAVLQGFPADYPWQGARTRQFEQVGNAIPPPLAQCVLQAAMRKKRRTGRRTR